MRKERESMAKRVVIIGGVATGMKTAARLRRRDKDVEIIVLERGPQLSYGACGFPYYVSKFYTGTGFSFNYLVRKHIFSKN